MDKLNFGGVLSAVNAYALSDDGHYAFLFDPRVDATIRINLQNGSRDVLRWYDHSFHHRRWLCYCMFTMHRDNATYLPALFFNTKRKMFFLVTFMLDDQKCILYNLQENLINADPVRYDRLAYNAHKDESKLHIIFYDRFTRHSHSDPLDEQASSLSFVYCCFNCHTLRVSTKKGTLPPGQWELPFIAHQSVHFISTEHSTTQLASISIDAIERSESWNVRTLNDPHPPRKAVWCNAWRNGVGWYVVCEKIARESEISRNITIWQLDVLDCKWRKLPVSINTPVTAANFALRIDLRDKAFLHCDWDRDAIFYKFDLNDLMLKREDEEVAAAAAGTEEEDEFFSANENQDNPEYSGDFYPEIICPICMDTYDDPRTLSCGHSVCNNCAEQMKAAAQCSTIRCFACRKATTIPTGGLPINFGLRDAIDALERARQLNFSNLRCARCHTQCEESGMWMCLQCGTEGGVRAVSQESGEAVGDAVKKLAFCAQCTLKFHNEHSICELPQFRDRCKAVQDKNLKCEEKVKNILKELKLAFAKKIEPLLLKPLREDVLGELSTVCDAMLGEEDTISKKADDTIEKFEERVAKITENIDIQFKLLISSSGNRGSRYERPTEL